MKAIVVRQPWATLIALGVKTIETRPSPPNGPMRPDGVRGLPGCSLERGERIAIVAGAQMPPDAVSFGDWTVWRWGAGAKMDRRGRREVTGEEIDLPLGAVVCTVTVEDALPIVDGHPSPEALRLAEALGRNLTVGDGSLFLDRWPDEDHGSRTDITDQLPLGDFTHGRWGWLLDDPQPLTKPCPTCVGSGLARNEGSASGWSPCLCHQGRVPCDPIPCKGQQGVFRLPDDVAAQIGGES